MLKRLEIVNFTGMSKLVSSIKNGFAVLPIHILKISYFVDKMF